MDERSLKSLLRPDAYPEDTKNVRLVQTHVSFIFITDNFAYKIKKPVDFGFLNFTTIDRRRFYCSEEVRLNRRLCPDIYLGVVELREAASGVSFCGEGKIIDYAVRMKRLPEERMLDRMLSEGKVTELEIRRIARTIAGFHLDAERGEAINDYGRVAAIHNNWEENFQQIEKFTGISIQATDLSIIRGYIENFIKENEALFAQRLENGFIRDCDGDIHMENICLTDPVCIFDCIEFNNRFRYTDTAADIAFFLMDLDFHGKREFAKPFLEEYCTVTGDSGLLPVLDFYMIYRAFVRGKVESLKMAEAEVPDEERIIAAEKAGRYFRLARGYILRKRMPPTMIITCGVMGSGKSTAAQALAFELGMDILSSDALRKKMSNTTQGKRGLDEYGKGIYSPSFDEAVYRGLLFMSEESLKSGRNLIVDATFRRRSDRHTFAGLAAKSGVSFFIVHTFCPDSLAKERLIARAMEPSAVSDGRWEIYQPQMDEFEPPGNGEGKLIPVDTSLPVADNVNMILRVMEIL